MTTDLASVRAELESEQTWRQDEIRFLRNQLASISGNKRKMQFRRALVVMLYAHYEGFCKFALERYVRAVNDADIKCGEATAAVVAGSWRKIFTAIETGDQKSKVFKSRLPNDDRLHRFARRREFIEEFRDFESQVAEIPSDTIDTESNLWPIVMQKNLYLIGLDHEAFSQHDGNIRQLMHRRNNISHGLERDGLTAQKYNKIERAVFKIMDDLMTLLMDAIAMEHYKQSPVQGATT